LFDSGSQEKLISEDIFQKLSLETIPHPKPYPLGWVCENSKLQVTKKCILGFLITANFLDEVELDVVLLYICSIVLGSTYIYDKRFIIHHHEKKYHLFKNVIEYIFRAYNKKLSLSPVNVGQTKRIVNTSQNFALLMFKHKDVEETKYFQGCESSLKSDFIGVSNSYDKIF